MSETVERHAMWVGGKERDAQEWVDDLDPSTGQVHAAAPRGTAEDVDAAVSSAHQAQSAWGGLLPRERGQMLIALADAIDRRAEELADLELRDTGHPRRDAYDDVATASGYFRFYGEAVDKVHGQHIEVPGGFATSQRVAYGVTGHIIPWNFPLVLLGRTTAPALAMGNACVVKPAEETPLTALAVARLASEIGFPDGVLNVVTGLGHEAGAALAAHPGIAHLSFTGSREVGVEVMRASAQHTRPVMLELGGKSPSVVFADADVSAAVANIRGAAMANAGQVCSALTRVVVERPLHDELVEALCAEFGSMTVGPGRDDLDMGPLISLKQQSRVEEYVGIGRDEGAQVAVGGTVPAGSEGYFFAPTLLTGVDPSMRVAREEIFGPVLAVLAFDGVDEAVQVANGTVYGLVASVWTSDIDKGLSMASQLSAGQVYVNNWGLGTGIELPFGGTRGSGFGREKGVQALDEYSQTKTTVFAARR